MSVLEWFLGLLFGAGILMMDIVIIELRTAHRLSVRIIREAGLSVLRFLCKGLKTRWIITPTAVFLLGVMGGLVLKYLPRLIENLPHLM